MHFSVTTPRTGLLVALIIVSTCILFGLVIFSAPTQELSSAGYVSVEPILLAFLLILTVFLLLYRFLLIELEKRVSIEDEALSREHKLIIAAQVAGMSVWEIDVATQQVTLSDLFFERMKTTADTEGGYQIPLVKLLQRFCHPDDRHLIHNELEKVLEGEQQAKRFELRLIDHEQLTVPMLLEYQVVSDDASQPYCIYGYLLDISKRKKDLQALNLAQAALENTSDAILIAELDSGRFTWVNTQACQLLEYSFSELIALSVEDLSESLSVEGSQDLRRCLQKNKSLRMELHVTTANGRFLTLEASLNLLRVVKDEYIVAYLHDISKRKDKVKQLQSSEERFTKGLDLAEIGIWDWNVNTGDLYWSKQIAVLFGYEVGGLDASYDNFMQAVHPDDRSLLQEAIDGAIEQDLKYDIEHRVLWPDGSVHWLKATGAVLKNSQGRALNMMGVSQDVTEQKLAQDEVRLKSMELKAFNKAMVGRESRMIELKEEVNDLCEQLGKPAPYSMEWLEK